MLRWMLCVALGACGGEVAVAPEGAVPVDVGAVLARLGVGGGIPVVLSACDAFEVPGPRPMASTLLTCGPHAVSLLHAPAVAVGITDAQIRTLSLGSLRQQRKRAPVAWHDKPALDGQVAVAVVGTEGAPWGLAVGTEQHAQMVGLACFGPSEHAQRGVFCDAVVAAMIKVPAASVARSRKVVPLATLPSATSKSVERATDKLSLQMHVHMPDDVDVHAVVAVLPVDAVQGCLAAATERLHRYPSTFVWQRVGGQVSSSASSSKLLDGCVMDRLGKITWPSDVQVRVTASRVAP